MVSRTVLFLLVMLGFASSASAQIWRRDGVRGNNWEVSLQSRYTGSYSNDTGNGSSLSIENSMGWGFGVGYNINPHFLVGGAFGWRSPTYRATFVNAEDPTETGSYGSTLDTSTFGVMAQWKPLDKALTPYVHGSISWMLINTNIYAGSVPGCWWDPWWGYVCGRYPTTYGANATSGSLGIGGHVEVGTQLFIRAGYEYGWIDNSAVDGVHLFRVDIGLVN